MYKAQIRTLNFPLAKIRFLQVLKTKKLPEGSFKLFISKKIKEPLPLQTVYF